MIPFALISLLNGTWVAITSILSHGESDQPSLSFAFHRIRYVPISEVEVGCIRTLPITSGQLGVLVSVTKEGSPLISKSVKASPLVLAV